MSNGEFCQKSRWQDLLGWVSCLTIVDWVPLPPKITISTNPADGISLCPVYKWQCDIEKSKACKEYGEKQNYCMAGCFPGAEGTFYYLPAHNVGPKVICAQIKPKSKDCKCIGLAHASCSTKHLLETWQNWDPKESTIYFKILYFLNS